MSHYRKYTDNKYINECMAKDYSSACKKLKVKEGDKVFLVEEDNHEVECGIGWIKELLDNPDNRE